MANFNLDYPRKSPETAAWAWRLIKPVLEKAGEENIKPITLLGLVEALADKIRWDMRQEINKLERKE